MAAVFVDFHNNKCNFLHKNKLDIIHRVQLLTQRRPTIGVFLLSYGSRHHCNETDLGAGGTGQLPRDLHKKTVKKLLPNET